MNALITVTGKQRNFCDEEPEVVEVIARGKCYERNHSMYIFYEEELEGVDGKINSSIKINQQNQTVEISKKGAMENQMFFSLGKKTNSLYQTQFGLLEMGMDTDQLKVEKGEDKWQMELHYLLEVNCQQVAEHTVYVSAVIE
ncbi:MAG: DUF1934 domain-containing protein [Lachnospiraceae bacterium]